MDKRARTVKEEAAAGEDAVGTDRSDAMHAIDIEEAAKQLSTLVNKAVSGESFVIARDGKPLVKVEALDAASKCRRVGFLSGEIVVPDDFDRMGETEIAAMFRADV